MLRNSRITSKIALAMLVLGMLLSGCGKNLENSRNSVSGKPKSDNCVTSTIFAMDTYMSLSVYKDEDKITNEIAENALKEMQQEIYRLDKMLSAENKESEVGVLNANRNHSVSTETAELWQAAKAVFDETDGAFDITIYPVMKAWGFGEETKRVPKKNTIQALLSNVDSNKVSLDETSMQMKLSNGVQIDFGGIAKGYLGDQLAKILEKNGIEHAMLNLGGNVRLVGTKPSGRLFHVAVKNPDGSDNYLAILNVADVNVVTSGGYERYFEEDGQVYHHILDPKTGFPANNGLTSVTVICTDGAKADGYSTALYVMGTEKAIDFWKNGAKDYDLVLYTQDGKLFITEGIEGSFQSDLGFEVIR